MLDPAFGWTLLAGIVALIVVVAFVAFVWQARATARRRGASALDGLLVLGPALVALGIIFGDDPLIGYSFIGAGVVVTLFAFFANHRRG